jgi:endoglucanase
MGESGENTDEWIGQFTRMLERNEVGWCFWPYKKMEQTSCVVAFEKPVYWDEIIAYAKMPGNSGESEKRIAARPSIERSREALRDLLKTIRFENCRINSGYVKAVGLTVPGK